MNFPGNSCRRSLSISQCSSCCHLRFQPYFSFTTAFSNQKRRREWSHMLYNISSSRLEFCRRTETRCRLNDTEPDDNDDKEKLHEDDESPPPDGSSKPNEQSDSQPSATEQLTNDLQMDRKCSHDPHVTFNYQTIRAGHDSDGIQFASGSPLPGVKPQILDEFIRIPKETIDILKNQVFGFDTFFVTSQEPYEGGLLFKGNLRGQAAESFKKLTTRLQNKFGDQYKLFLLINPEDDKPIAVVVPRKTLQPEPGAVPEWLAAGAFGLVTVFTLLLRNVPALQSNLLSAFDNVGLLKDGVAGAMVTALVLGVHEVGHILAANSVGVKLGVPYFVPSWQIGCFGGITRIVNIVAKREDLLKVAVAGPLAGFGLGMVLLLLGFVLPPSDGIGVIVDASVFHESFLVGGLAKVVLGDVLKEGSPLSVNPLVIWAWAGLLINAINSIPAGETDGGRVSFAIWGRKVSSRVTGASIALLGLSSLFNDVAFYWVALIFVLQRGPIAPLSEEVSDPQDNYVALGIFLLFLGLITCLPYPFPFTHDNSITTF